MEEQDKRNRKKLTDEELEILFKVAHGIITWRDASSRLGFNPAHAGKATHWVGTALRSALSHKQIAITVVS